jgi:hypothetical protein
MAYGVKYRLIFSDLLGHAKKVEILQDGYTGEVSPMIGTGDPVQIEWEGDDDFYEPIIGSSCTLNLLVTDDVTYDDFFKGAEEEYRVQIYYDRNQSNVFQDRVEEIATNAGCIEVPECIENELTQGNTISSDFTTRVLNDGGTIDNESCIGKSITNSKTYDWATFWEGFLYLDTYSEALATTPYEISITALDGLGLLDVNDSRALNVYVLPLLYGANLGEWYYVSEMLQEFNKDATAVERYLYWAGDIQWTGTSDFIGDIPARPWSTYSNIDDKFNFLNNKEVLENILRKSNSRIFHAFGDWYVVPNSLYLDDVFSGQYYDRTVFKNALANGQNEVIDFQVFGVGDGRTFEGNATKNVTKRIKKDLQPVDNDMSIEYLSPLNKVIIESDLKQEAQILGRLSNNVGFTFGSGGYTLSYGAVATTHDFVGSNNQSYKLTNFTTNAASRITAIVSDGSFKFGNYIPADNVEYSFEYLFDSTATNPSYKLYYSTKISYSNNVSFSPTLIKYHDVENNTMENTIVYNEIFFQDVLELQRWQKETKTLPNSFNGLYQLQVDITFYQPVLNSGTGYSALYLDNIRSFDTDMERDNQTLTSTISENRGVYDFEVVPNEELCNAFFDFASNTKIPVDDDKNNAQQILNDYRTYVPRYEATGYGNKNKPVTPLDKLFVDFKTHYQDDQASMIDTLKYNLRRNIFKIITHTPNNDPDVTVTHQLRQN